MPFGKEKSAYKTSHFRCRKDDLSTTAVMILWAMQFKNDRDPVIFGCTGTNSSAFLSITKLAD